MSPRRKSKMENMSTVGDVNPRKRRHGADDTNPPSPQRAPAKEQSAAGAAEKTTSVASGTAGAVAMDWTGAGATKSRKTGGTSEPDAGPVAKEKERETASF